MAANKTAEISASELELKRRGRRRLVGAVVIGLLAVVFLPMIFDSEPKQKTQGQQEISIQLPDKDKQQPLPAPSVPALAAPTQTPPVAPQVAGEAITPDKAPEAAPPAAKPAPEPKAAPPKAAAAPKVTAKAVPAPAPTAPAAAPAKSAAPAAEAKGNFTVQIGVFRDAEHVKEMVAKLKDAKLPVSTESIAIANGKATRVRVGPYAERVQADAALAEVKLTGMDGKVVPLKQ